MKRPLLALFVCISLAVAVFLPASHPVQASNVTKSVILSNPDEDAPADYCVKKGGEVDARIPYFNTNDDNQQNWVRLSGRRFFCKFTSKADGSRIHVALTTLYTKAPSLAALAYYAKVPYAGNCNGNPASCYCSQLGGTDLFGGINSDADTEQ